MVFTNHMVEQQPYLSPPNSSMSSCSRSEYVLVSFEHLRNLDFEWDQWEFNEQICINKNLYEEQLIYFIIFIISIAVSISSIFFV
jgi:hypothetical protein